MNDKVNLTEDEAPAYKKKSKKKGLPRSKHKHIYETVLLISSYHYNNFKTGRPEVSQTMLPTKVCTVCGRVDETDDDSSYYVKIPVPNIPFITHRELSEKALGLPKWEKDFFDKFAIKMEEEDGSTDL